MAFFSMIIRLIFNLNLSSLYALEKIQRTRALLKNICQGYEVASFLMQTVTSEASRDGQKDTDQDSGMLVSAGSSAIAEKCEVDSSRGAHSEWRCASRRAGDRHRPEVTPPTGI
jgi:hypothetical protein